MRFPYILLLLLFLTSLLPAQDVTIAISDSVLVPSAQRLGINVGGRSWWGAEQIMKNLIDNPGFESGEFASLVLVNDGATERIVPMAFWDPAWNNEQYGIGWPQGFWDNAEYEFLWGAAKGRKGKVAAHRHANGNNEFELDINGTIPNRMSVLRLYRNVPGYNGNPAVVDATAVRPGSAGKQSLRIVSGGNSLRFYMDSLWRDGDRTAGKLLIIRGEYICRFWVKAARAGDRLRIRFFREGEGVFLDESLSPGTDWQQIERRFTVPEGADPVREYTDEEYHPILAFILEAENQGAEFLVDDLELYSTAHANPTVFTDNFVNRLKELRPGALRYWAGQLGASLESQLAVPFARRTNGYAPRDRRPGDFCYSLHEFLELCRETGADPWYVIPPTFNSDELRGLVEYLAAPASPAFPLAMQRAALGQQAPWTSLFGALHLEYGNEMWGSGSGDDPFMGSSVNGGERLASIAHDRFSIMRSSPHFDAARFKLVIGGQAGYAGRQREIEQYGSAHDAVALAPYFGVLDTWNNSSEIFQPLLASPLWQAASGPMRESRGHLGERELSIYEINFHTTHGSSPIELRNDFLTGAAGALALPLHMLVYQRDLGARTQCAFSSLGYNFRLQNGDFAKLWGMLRDVEATGRKRPTWLGVELVNKCIVGDMLLTRHGTPQPSWTQPAINGIGNEVTVSDVQSFSFGDGIRRGLVLFNLNLDQPRSVRLQLPEQPADDAMLYSIAPASIHDDNEDSSTVGIDSLRINAFSDGFEFDLPPHSIHALIWTRGTSNVEEASITEFALNVRYASTGEVLLLAQLPSGNSAEVEVRDVLGRRVALLATGVRGPGTQAMRWNPPASGVYIATLRTATQQIMRVMSVVR